ncbi:MAG: class I SAM-dependent methyltransferase [Patescibacteria group bacterium]
MTDTLRATYNRIASDYSTDHQHDTWDDDFVARFLELLPQSSSMLDLGCGPGWETHRMKRAGLQQTGLDLSEELLEIARKNNPQAAFVQGDMRHLPFPSDTFDGVFAKASLLHLQKTDVPLVLDEILRILKPNGILHLALKKQRVGQPPEEIVTENDYGYTYERFFSYWAMSELLSVLQKHQFIVLESEESPSTSGRTTWLKVLASKNIYS